MADHIHVVPNTPRELPVCYLCGRPIEKRPADPDFALSMDHVPPKQFYPKDIRLRVRGQLTRQPSHRTCSGDYKLDEEYFYHSMSIVVEQANPAIYQAMFSDLSRRAEAPQTHAIIKKLLGSASPVTAGGVYLPPGMAQFGLDAKRINRVALKVARGLLFAETRRYVPPKNMVGFDSSLGEGNDPELYQRIQKATAPKGVYPSIFAYWYLYLPPQRLHWMATSYWESVWFCMAFSDTQNPGA